MMRLHDLVTSSVMPDATGYVVDVLNDSSLPSTAAEAVGRTRLASNWIFIGRDQELEQAIIADLQSRLAVPVTGMASTP